MFRKNTLQQRATKQLGFMDNFISQLEKAKDEAEVLSIDAQIEIDKAKEVQRSCDKVQKFVNKVIG